MDITCYDILVAVYRQNAKPGMVIYHSYRTVIVNPYPEIVVDALNAEKKETEE